ncbi:Phosphotyrosyl phosphatase activator [Trametes sanguinea]|nr:Phosphotyrosyl phosphatase activator [Trametes sanguinea]
MADTTSVSSTGSQSVNGNSHEDAAAPSQSPQTGFLPPRKVILTKEQLEAFQQSKTHETIVSYINTLNECVVGVKLTDDVPVSSAVQAVLDILDRIAETAKGIPPVDNKASRFGNPAFRTFYDKVSEIAPELHRTIPEFPEAAIPEVSVYFEESWGNRTRIDYGSGMELNFLCWMICVEKLGIFKETDHVALVVRVFWRYIEVMRVLQSTYWLEPAGSHGVWGLDDYHFLPFLWGAAQLRGHKYIRPKSIHDSDTVEEFSKHYMYLACIKFINSVKTASLRWHSPMLDDISAVKTWDKVNSGLIKMYHAEVLGKLPVMQHFLFGSLLPWEGPMPPAPEGAPGQDDAHWGHAHAMGDRGGVGQREVGWGDCCGIPVPSAFAAKEAEERRRNAGVPLAGPGIRPVPFD